MVREPLQGDPDESNKPINRRLEELMGKPNRIDPDEKKTKTGREKDEIDALRCSPDPDEENRPVRRRLREARGEENNYDPDENEKRGNPLDPI